jgi:hypothetical protein
MVSEKSSRLLRNWQKSANSCRVMPWKTQFHFRAMQFISYRVKMIIQWTVDLTCPNSHLPLTTTCLMGPDFYWPFTLQPMTYYSNLSLTSACLLQSLIFGPQNHHWGHRHVSLHCTIPIIIKLMSFRKADHTSNISPSNWLDRSVPGKMRTEAFMQHPGKMRKDRKRTALGLLNPDLLYYYSYILYRLVIHMHDIY